MPDKCKNRERILASGTVDIPGLPVGAVRGNLCFRCFSPSSNLLRCSGCKRAGYCSKECQKLDWSIIHKNYCKIFKTINQVEEQQYQEKRTWNEYRAYLLKTVRSIRDAAPKDENLHFIVQAQAYCASCRRTAVQLSTRKITLTKCDQCRLIFSCSDCGENAKHSVSICANYQLHAHIENFRIGFFEDTGKFSPVTCTQFPRTDRKLLKDTDSEGWYDYFVSISDKPQIRGIISPNFLSLGPGERTADEKDQHERMRMFLLCATDNLTMPLTILSALEDISWTKPHLKIHIVGATGREMLALGNFEEILHLMPGLKSLQLTAVGPNVWAGGAVGGKSYVPKTELECCQVCKRDGGSRSVALYCGLYHDFITTPDYEEADLVVAFNSGFVDGDDSQYHWDSTIKLLVESGVPCLFTTYNAQEAQNEKTKMLGLKAKFLVEPQKNKWSGLIPTPEFIDEEYGMWFQNDYRYIIQGRIQNEHEAT
jgi:splicing suppressor protein 51